MDSSDLRARIRLRPPEEEDRPRRVSCSSSITAPSTAMAGVARPRISRPYLPLSSPPFRHAVTRYRARADGRTPVDDTEATAQRGGYTKRSRHGTAGGLTFFREVGVSLILAGKDVGEGNRRAPLSCSYANGALTTRSGNPHVLMVRRMPGQAGGAPYASWEKGKATVCLLTWRAGVT